MAKEKKKAEMQNNQNKNLEKIIMRQKKKFEPYEDDKIMMTIKDLSIQYLTLNEGKENG